VEDVLSPIDQWTQGLHEELNTEIEKTQLGLQAVTTSLNMWTKNLRKELDMETLDMKRQTTKALVETTGCGLETRPAEVKAQAEHGCGGRT
jgi:hypothetical protein